MLKSAIKADSQHVKNNQGRSRAVSTNKSDQPPLAKFKESATMPFNELGKRGTAISSGSRGTDMVERQLDGLERQGLGEWGPRSNNIDRCFPSRVGSCLQWNTYGRPLDTIR